jgi:hypothetical protein
MNLVMLELPMNKISYLDFVFLSYLINFKFEIVPKTTVTINRREAMVRGVRQIARVLHAWSSG